MITRFLGAAVFALLPVWAFGQTSVQIGASSVRAADDFATRAFQDPWDMNQRTDLGAFLDGTDQPQPNLANISFVNGIFSGTSTNSDPSVFLLETGNPFAARLGKIGTNYPIDANTYKLLALRMSVSTTTAQMQFFWNRETAYDNSLTAGTPNFLLSQGFRVYLLDMTALPTALLGAAAFPWGGQVGALRFDPTNQANDTVQLDWVRLVSVNPSLCRTISWSGGGSTFNIYLLDAASNNLGPLALSVSNNTASPGCSPSGSGYTFYAGALAPGTYKIAVVTAGTSIGAGNISSGTWIVNDIPTLQFTSPSEEGSSDDFATTVLGNPWDMSGPGDIDMVRYVNNPQFTQIPLQTAAGVDLGPQPVFTGTSVPNPFEGWGDPHLGLLWNPGRGATHRIDPLHYRILTLEMGVQSFARNINEGSIARVVWRVAGNEVAGESVSNDIIFTSRAGASVVNRIIVDMADRDVLSIDEGATAGWVRGTAPNPGLDLFRIDPHEYTPVTPFFIRRVKLAAFERTSRFYTINWNFTDSSGAGTVDLYYDNDGTGFDGTLIAANLPTTAEGSYVWDTLGVSLPQVHIYAVFRDSFAGGANENRVYARWPLILTSNTPPQVSVNRTRLNFAVTNGTTRTSAQAVRVSISGSAGACWSVHNPQPSLFTVSPQTGTGTGTFTVSLVNQNYSPGLNVSSTFTVGPCSGGSIGNTAAIRVDLLTFASTAPPVGVMDTPAEGSTVSGSIAVTGWVIDDIDIASVTIWRDPVQGEAGPRVFVGHAVRVDDARPDIEAAANHRPFQYRAGWGYLLLTNFLPNGGNGTYRLLAYATDAEGREALLGARTIVGANALSTKPFGGIDTPGQGETVGGTAYLNWGWVLVRGSARAHPPFGAVTVYIDSLAVGFPGLWTERPDIVSLFPEATYAGVRNAVGLYTFDTTAYANGVHTIAWVVTASNGETDGIGSRFFNIFNPGGASMARSSGSVLEAPHQFNAGTHLGRAVRDVGRGDAETPITAGYGLSRPSLRVIPDVLGVRTVAVLPSQRVVIDASSDGGHSYEAYLAVAGTLRALPLGASFDERRGVLYWQPPLGFTGAYDFIVVRDGYLRTAVRVMAAPHSKQWRAQAATGGWLSGR